MACANTPSNKQSIGGFSTKKTDKNCAWVKELAASSKYEIILFIMTPDVLICADTNHFRISSLFIVVGYKRIHTHNNNIQINMYAVWWWQFEQAHKSNGMWMNEKQDTISRSQPFLYSIRLFTAAPVFSHSNHWRNRTNDVFGQFVGLSRRLRSVNIVVTWSI